MLDPTAASTAALRALVLRCVPAFSDYCGVAAVTHGRPAEYLLEYPTTVQRPEWERTLRTPVFVPEHNGRPGEQLVMLHWWRDRRQPSLPDALMALSLADQALLRVGVADPSMAAGLLRVAS